MNETANILVTGSSRGLGRGIALRLAKAGYGVAIHYANNRAAADETARDCEAAAINKEQKFPGDVVIMKEVL